MLTYNNLIIFIQSKSKLINYEVWEYDSKYYYGNVYRVLLKLDQNITYKNSTYNILFYVFDNVMEKYKDTSYEPNAEEICDEIIQDLDLLFKCEIE